MMFFCFLSTIAKSILSITTKNVANGHVKVELITEFNCKIYIRRLNIIAPSKKAILVIIRKLLLLGIRFPLRIIIIYCRNIKTLKFSLA